MESFEKYNTYPITRGIIIEDSAEDISYARDILKSIPNLELINTGGRQGQIKNIDRCFATIDTKYVFHCEDDFAFTKPGFIENSIKIMEAEPECINVWLTPYEKAWEDPTSTHRQIPPDHRQFNLDGVTYWNVNSATEGEWGLGFTYQPAVKRMSDYHKIGSYESLLKVFAPWANLYDGGQTERNLARYYVTAGYHTRMFAGPNDNEEGYVYNTGTTRHVPLPTKSEL